MAYLVETPQGRRFRCAGCKQPEQPVFLWRGKVYCAGCLLRLETADCFEKCLLLQAASKALRARYQAQRQALREKPPPG